MDKFGIFKLLNSFFSLNDDKNTSSSPDKKNPEDALSAILSSLSNKNTDTTPAKPSAPTTPERKTVPLQKNMISVMNSHDEFIKRVKRNNPVK